MDSNAAETPDKFQNNWKILNSDIEPLRLSEIVGQDVQWDNEIVSKELSLGDRELTDDIKNGQFPNLLATDV